MALPNGTGWSVEYQTETIDFDAMGHAVSGMKVGIVTGRGIHTSVFIPRAIYSVEEVKRRAALWAAEVDAAHMASG